MARAFFSARGLTAFREMAEANQPDTATRYIPEDTAGTGGETSTTYVSGSQQTACRLEPVGVTEGETEDTVLASGEWLLALPITALVLPRDRFVVTGTGIDDATWSRTVEVVGTPGPHTWESERVVRCTSRIPVTVTHRLTLTSTLAPVGAQT